MNFPDRVVEYIAPQWAARRAEARHQLSIYRGSAVNRRTANITHYADSGDSALANDRDRLRGRHHSLYRNHPIAKGIRKLFIDNVVSTGYRPRAVIDHEALGISPKHARQAAKEIERAGQAFIRKDNIDVGQRMALWGMCRQIVGSYLDTGEGLVVKQSHKPRFSILRKHFNTGWRILETDRIDTPPGEASNPRIRKGVELDPDTSAPIAYHLRDQHPGDHQVKRLDPNVSFNSFTRIPRLDSEGRPNVFHLYRPSDERPEQTRGEPILSSALALFKDSGDYFDAQVMKQKVRAFYALFIKTPNPWETGGETNADGEKIRKIQPGMIRYLGNGEEPLLNTGSDAPQGDFEGFIVMLLRWIGACVGMPLELILKDFSRTNYSSARAALLEARRVFRALQQWLIEDFCQEVWEQAIEEAFLLGMLPSIRNFYDAPELWTRALWLVPAWGWVDPLKEVLASKEAVEAGFSTKTDECAALNRDYEEVIDTKKREQEYEQSRGIIEVSTEPTPKGVAQDEAERDTIREKAKGNGKISREALLELAYAKAS